MQISAQLEIKHCFGFLAWNLSSEKEFEFTHTGRRDVFVFSILNDLDLSLKCDVENPTLFKLRCSLILPNDI